MLMALSRHHCLGTFRLLLVGCISVSSIVCSNMTRKTELNTHDHGALPSIGRSTNQDYCTGETFRPRCSGGKNDVIVILSARYGRMSFGRCLEDTPEFAGMRENPRFVGCSADVKHILDQHCSGLAECDVRVISQNFEDVKPCIVGLQMYLEASYVCVRVATESRHCTVGLTVEPQHVVGGGRSRLVQSDTVGCGVESQPWSVEALAGQRIAVSIIEFGRSETSNDGSKSVGCNPMYGYVVDRNARRNVSVCGDQRTQQSDDSSQKTVYVSRSNQLQIVIKNDADFKFIIRLEAVGCSDLAPPSDAAWLKRVDDQITVGCYMSRQSWQLNCVNGVWTGTVGVCSHLDESEVDILNAGERMQVASATDGLSSSTEVAALAAVASAGVAVCCLVICVGVMCFRRQQTQLMKKCAGKSANEDTFCHGNSRTNTGLLINMTSCDENA